MDTGWPSAISRVVSAASVAASAVAICAVIDGCAGGSTGDAGAGIELRAANRLRGSVAERGHVSVTSYNRQVLLTGTVGAEADRRRVEEIARGLDNVRNVVNEVAVGSASGFQQRSNDTFITGKVKASLLDAKDIFATSFKVVTERNVVYLMGLATRRETDRATDITRGVAGVEKVVRVVEILSEAELASQTRQGGTGPSPNTVNSVAPAARSSVPLPPMEPLPAGGATVTPVR